MSSGLKKSLIAVTVSGLMASSAAYATNGYFAHGYSTKEKGLAGAGVAHSQDALAVATNPAGIAGMDSRMDIGAALFNPNRSYTVSGAPSITTTSCPTGAEASCGIFSLDEGKLDSGSDLFLIPHIGYVWKLDTESSVALGVYGNGGMNTNYNGGGASYFLPAGFGGPDAVINPPGTFGAGDAGVNLAQLFFNLAYAKKINAENSIGASLIFAYQQFKADGMASFAAYSLDSTKLTNNGDDTSTGFGAKIGWQGKVSSDVTLGLSYQTEIAMSEFDKYSGLFAEGGDFDIPATLILGAAWAINDKSTVVVDLQQIYYEDVAAIANGIQPLLNGSCTPATPTPTPPSGAGCLGGANGAGFGWKDMTVIKVGYEWMMDDMTMRVGVSSTDGPITGAGNGAGPGQPSDSQVMFNILAPGVVETHLTFGLTVPLGADAEFSFAGMYAPNTDVTGNTQFDPAQTVKLEMDQFEVQGTYTMKF